MRYEVIEAALGIGGGSSRGKSRVRVGWWSGDLKWRKVRS